MRNPYETLGLPLYDKLWSGTSFVQEERQLVLSELRGARKVLEVGCGVGTIVRYLVEAGKQVTAIDSYGPCVDYLKREVPSNQCTVLKMDALHLPFVNKFDGAVCASTIAYISDAPKLAATTFKALRQNGVFIVIGYEDWKKHTTLNLSDVDSRIRSGALELTEQQLRRASQVERPDSYPADSLDLTLRALTGARFEILRTELFYHDTCYLAVAAKRGPQP